MSGSSSPPSQDVPQSLYPELKIRRAFDTIYPGLIDRISQYPGNFVDDKFVQPHSVKPDRNGEIQSASISFRFVFDDGMMIRIGTRVRRVGFTWKREMWSYHCGPSSKDITDTYFRIDCTPNEVLHCHIRGSSLERSFEKGGHWLRDQVTQPIGDVDPFRFLDWVESFRATKQMPIKVKGTR